MGFRVRGMTGQPAGCHKPLMEVVEKSLENVLINGRQTMRKTMRKRYGFTRVHVRRVNIGVLTSDGVCSS